VTAYYNEKDKFAAAWLRELIKMGQIAPGVVDERSIEDIQPSDLSGYTQCHFFAGIGVWSYALRRAGWPDDRSVWTGSCPCQPFSAAGKGDGFADERHLWPAWFHLITTAKPDDVPVFGEQVASKAGLIWLDLVQTDMEGAGHAFGAVDLCAAGIGAPHIRQRLFFVAETLGDTSGEGPPEQRRERDESEGFTAPSVPGGMADSKCERYPELQQKGAGYVPGRSMQERTRDGLEPSHTDNNPGPTNGLWRDADWLLFRDGKWRPVEPGTFPLVDGAAARVGRLRGYGNAINAEVAAAFIEAYLSIRHTVVPVNFL